MHNFYSVFFWKKLLKETFISPYIWSTRMYKRNRIICLFMIREIVKISSINVLFFYWNEHTHIYTYESYDKHVSQTKSVDYDGQCDLTIARFGCVVLPWTTHSFVFIISFIRNTHTLRGFKRKHRTKLRHNTSSLSHTHISYIYVCMIYVYYYVYYEGR